MQAVHAEASAERHREASHLGKDLNLSPHLRKRTEATHTHGSGCLVVKRQTFQRHTLKEERREVGSKGRWVIQTDN